MEILVSFAGFHSYKNPNTLIGIFQFPPAPLIFDGKWRPLIVCVFVRTTIYARMIVDIVGSSTLPVPPIIIKAKAFFDLANDFETLTYT